MFASLQQETRVEIMREQWASTLGARANLSVRQRELLAQAPRFITAELYSTHNSSAELVQYKKDVIANFSKEDLALMMDLGGSTRPHRSLASRWVNATEWILGQYVAVLSAARRAPFESKDNCNCRIDEDWSCPNSVACQGTMAGCYTPSFPPCGLLGDENCTGCCLGFCNPNEG